MEVSVLTISNSSSSHFKDVCEQRHDRSLPEQNAKWTIDLCMLSISWIFSGGGRSRYNIYRIHQVDPTTIAGTGEVCARKGRKTVFFNTRRSETVNTSHMDRILSWVVSLHLNLFQIFESQNNPSTDNWRPSKTSKGTFYSCARSKRVQVVSCDGGSASNKVCRNPSV